MFLSLFAIQFVMINVPKFIPCTPDEVILGTQALIYTNWTKPLSIDLSQMVESSIELVGNCQG